MRRALAPAIALLFSGCGPAKLPQPALGPHTEPVGEWAEIDTPPRPVQVEEVSPRPGPEYLWIDGSWDYQPLAKRWTWQPGRWCVPPPGALYYAPAQAARFRKATGRTVIWNGALNRYEEV